MMYNNNPSHLLRTQYVPHALPHFIPTATVILQTRKLRPRKAGRLAYACTTRGEAQKCGCSQVCWRLPLVVGTSVFPPLPVAWILGWLCLMKRNVLYAIWTRPLGLATIFFVTSVKMEFFFRNSDFQRAELGTSAGGEEQQVAE